MPRLVLKPMPELSVDNLMEIFKRKFASTYEIYTSKLIGFDFVIKKSNFTGISIKLKQKEDKTIIIYNALSPAFWVRFLFYGLIPLIILYLGPWKTMQTEIKEFLETSPEFMKYHIMG